MEKRNQIIIYLAKSHGRANKTILMKLSYLIDLISVSRNKKQITDFNYIRYLYGPFDSSLYTSLQDLLDKQILLEESEFTPDGNEYTFYTFNESKLDDLKFDLINDGEISLIDEVLQSLKGYGAKTLTEICYGTKPMKSIGAQIGNKEGFYTKLNLNLVVPTND